MAAGGGRRDPAGPGGSGAGVVGWSLLRNDALILEVDPELAEVAGAWVPISHRDRQRVRGGRNREGTGGVTDGLGVPSVVLRLRAGEPAQGSGTLRERGDPLVGLGSVRGWEDPDSGGLRVQGGLGTEGLVLPGARRADLSAPEGIGRLPGGVMEIHSLLTLSAGLVLPSVDAALVHAAAVVAPGVGSLLLVGDSHAGKTTTCVNLVEQGWRFLSDDHTVLQGADTNEGSSEGALQASERITLPGEPGAKAGPGREGGSGTGGGIMVEGWLRTMHLDEGWRGGAPTGIREDTDPGVLGTGLWCASAPLAGLLFPRVEADGATRIEAMSPGEALVGLIRQSPWLMADPVGAPRALGLLRHAALRPAFRLVLGMDTFRNGRRLMGVLEGVFPRGVRRTGLS